MIKILFSKSHTKFYNDTISFENDLFTVETNGVFYGIDATRQGRLGEFLISEYLKKGETFVAGLRGSFSIILFDKTKNKHLIYTNQIGDKRIFYSCHNNLLIVSNKIQSIISFDKENNIGFTLNYHAAYYLLTFGYMLHDVTLVQEIKRLKPGHYIMHENNSFQIKPYYTLNNKPNPTLSESEAIEQIDLLFRNAIKLEYEKDLEYNLKHFCSLSGGLDSRMNTWVAHEMGYADVTNFTFSQSGYLDMTISQQIATDLHHDWLFKTLDHGNFLLNLEEVMAINEGISTYSGQTHGKNAYDLVNFNNFGMFHSGMVGDVIISSFLTSDDYGVPSFAKMSSGKLKHKLQPENLAEYSNQELFLMYNRGFNGALTGHGPIQQYTEVASPFLDVDFMDFCLSLPLSMRKNHSLYKKWIIQKYPKAANYIWENIGTTIKAKTINIRGKAVPWKKLPNFIYWGLQFNLGLVDITSTESPNNMNPFDYWYKTNPIIPEFFNNYYNTNLKLVTDAELRKDCELLFTGTTVEKMQVLSLLAALKLIWD